MRKAHGPVAPVLLDGDVPAWLVLDYRELHQVTGDPVLFSRDSDLWNQWDRIPADWPLIGLANPGRSMLTVDGAEHRRLRTLIAQALTVRRVERLRAGIEKLTTRMLDRLAEIPAGETVDLKAEFAYPLPMNVVGELMGVDSADHPRLKALFEKFFSTQTPPAEVPQLTADLGALFARIVESKRAHPGDDLTSALIAASEDGDHLTTEEITNTLQLMIAASHETTISLIVNAVVALQTHPEQRKLVLDGQAPWENVIEETLRWSAPTSHVLIRFAAEDIEVGDTVLPRGEGLIVSFGAIGRDEDAHGPTAGDFDITRTPIGTSPSATARTSARVRPSPASKPASPCPRSSAASPSSTSPFPPPSCATSRSSPRTTSTSCR